ncbi:MAG: ABC transporter permease [Gammaproteobacteria bacterium]
MMRASVWLVLSVSLLPTLAGLLAAVVFGMDASAFERVLAAPGLATAISASVLSAVVSTALALIFAHLLVALAVTGGWRGRLTGWSLPLLAMPHLALGIGLALVLAPSGLILRLFSPWATGWLLPPDWLIVRDPPGLTLILGLTLKESCFLIMALVAALSQVPAQQYLHQGKALGYGALKTWLTTIAPLLQQQIRLPVAAVLVYGLSNVELALTLGPDLPPTFAVMLWRWLSDAAPDMQAQAFAGSLLLLALSVCVIALAAVVGRAARRIVLRAAESGHRRLAEQPLRQVIAGFAMMLWALGMLSILAIGLRSTAGPWRFPAILPQRFDAASWLDSLPALGATGSLTVIIGLLTAVLGVVLVLPAAEHVHTRPSLRQRVGVWLFVPLLLPQMTFLFGVQVLLTRLHIDGTVAAVVWLHLVFALPYLWGVLAPARAALDPRLTQVAFTLGQSSVATWWRITLPLLSRALLVAMALGFSISLALYLPTLFAGAGRVNTAATEAAAAVGSGSLRLAAVHAILLAAGPLLAFALAFTAGRFLYRSFRGVH